MSDRTAAACYRHLAICARPGTGAAYCAAASARHLTIPAARAPAVAQLATATSRNARDWVSIVGPRAAAGGKQRRKANQYNRRTTTGRHRQ